MIPEITMAVDTPNSERDPVVVLAADEAFAMPLAVTIRSALDHLARDRTLQIYVLDGGILPATKERLVKSWANSGSYRLHWVHVDPSALAGIEAREHWNVVAYYRLLMPRILPNTVTKVVYLDSDIIIRQDLGLMWDTDLAGNACLAVQDSFTPFLDASVALPNFHLVHSYIINRPIANFQALGLPPKTPYFNSGILLLDLSMWRELDLSAKMIKCLHDNREYVNWTDQYALNVGLAGRWGLMDPRWNQGTMIFTFPSWEFSPLDKKTFTAVRNYPYIVHYTTAEKPWHANSRHPFRREFFKYLDRTNWAGWRPDDDTSWGHWRKVQTESLLHTCKSLKLRLRNHISVLRDRLRTS